MRLASASRSLRWTPVCALLFAAAEAAAAASARASAFCAVTAMSSSRRLRAARESPSAFVCASTAAMRAASADSALLCLQRLLDFVEPRRDLINGRAVRALRVGRRRSVAATGTRPASQSPTTIAAMTIAPATAPMACGFRRPAKFQRARSLGASRSLRRSPSPAGSVPPASCACFSGFSGFSGFSVSTSVAVRSMVGGRRRGVLSGSLVMRSPGRGPPNSTARAGSPPRHSTRQGWRQHDRIKSRADDAITPALG